MKSVQQGFTLIELMIVVAIIGILAAIAIPQYQDYIARTQVSRVYSEISDLKTGVESDLMRGVYPTSATSVGFTSSDLMASAPVVDFTAANSGKGTITAVLGTSASNAVAKAIVQLQRTASGTWTCKIDGSQAGSWKSDYMPSGCSKK